MTNTAIVSDRFETISVSCAINVNFLVIAPDRLPRN